MGGSGSGDGDGVYWNEGSEGICIDGGIFRDRFAFFFILFSFFFLMK